MKIDPNIILKTFFTNFVNFTYCLKVESTNQFFSLHCHFYTVLLRFSLLKTVRGKQHLQIKFKYNWKFCIPNFSKFIYVSWYFKTNYGLQCVSLYFLHLRLSIILRLLRPNLSFRYSKCNELKNFAPVFQIGLLILRKLLPKFNVKKKFKF